MKNYLLLLLSILWANIASAQTVHIPVGKNINLYAFILQLTIAENNSVKQIEGDDLQQYCSPFFYWNSHNESIDLLCNTDGATTPNTNYPRTELRAKQEWHFQGNHALSVRMAVQQQPSTGKIIIGQIHGHSKGTEALKIWWNNGRIQVGVKNEVGTTEKLKTILENIKLGAVIDYQIIQTEYQVAVIVNGQKALFEFGKSWKDQLVYFKVGNYLQDNKKQVSSGLVSLYSVRLDP